LKKILAAGLALLVCITLWIFFSGGNAPAPSLYSRTWTGKAQGISYDREEFYRILQEMVNMGEKNMNIELSGFNMSLQELGKAISSAFSKTSDYYIKNSANYWEYDLKNQGGGISRADIRIFYQETGKQRNYVKRKAEDIAWKIIESDMSDIEKIKTVYEWVIKHVTYDGFYARHGGYHALKGKAVCQGYALLLYRMLEGLGYNSLIISGGDHMWNMVELDGKWYHLDATFDDIQEGLILKEHFINYANFLKSDQDMKKTGHTWSGTLYPKAPDSIASIY
jgi:hypothetical protein